MGSMPLAGSVAGRLVRYARVDGIEVRTSAIFSLQRQSPEIVRACCSVRPQTDLVLL